MSNFSASPIRGLVAFLWCASSSNRMLVWQNENFLGRHLRVASRRKLCLLIICSILPNKPSLSVAENPHKELLHSVFDTRAAMTRFLIQIRKDGGQWRNLRKRNRAGIPLQVSFNPMLNIYFEYMPKIRYLQCFQCAHASSKSHTDLLLMYFSCKATDPQLILLVSNAFMFRTLKHRDEHMGVKLHVINVR